MPLRPLDGVGSSLTDICRCQAEALAESPVVNHERLLPLVGHLVELSKQRAEDGDRLDHPSRNLTHADVAAQLRSEPEDEFLQRACGSARQHPWPAVHVRLCATER